jgi:hypothetical protein
VVGVWEEAEAEVGALVAVARKMWVVWVGPQE